MPRRTVGEGELTRWPWVIFDYGGVLCAPPSAAAKDALAGLIGVASADLWPAYWQHRPPYVDGRADDIDYWHAVCRQLGKPPADAELADRLVELDVRAWSRVDERVLGLVRDLAADGTNLASPGRRSSGGGVSASTSAWRNRIRRSSPACAKFWMPRPLTCCSSTIGSPMCGLHRDSASKRRCSPEPMGYPIRWPRFVADDRAATRAGPTGSRSAGRSRMRRRCALLPDETAGLTHPAGTSSSGCWPTESKKWATNVTSPSSASNRAMRAPSAS